MTLKIYNPQEVQELMRLAEQTAASKKRPKSIVAARMAYEQDREAVEEKARREGRIDQAETQRLALMRREVDALYDRWVNGDFASEELVPDPFL